VLLLIGELLLQLHELFFFALLNGIVLVGFLALLKGVTINNYLSVSSNGHFEAWSLPLASSFWRSSSIATGHDTGACSESCSRLDCESGSWANSFDEGL
jgi:hypothetical protein